MAAAQRSNPKNVNAKGAGPGKGVAKQGGKAAPAPAQVRAPKHESASLRLAWWCLHLIVFLVPIAISNLTWTHLWSLPLTYDQFDIAKIVVMRALTLIGFGAWAWHVLMAGGQVRFIRRGGAKPFRFFTWFEFLVLAMLVWLAITTLTSIHPPTALFGKYRRFEGLVSFINYATVFFLTIQLADRPSRIRSVIVTLFFSNLIVSGYAVLQFFGTVTPALASAVTALGMRFAALGPLVVAGASGIAAVWRRERDGLHAFEWAGVASLAWAVVISGISFTAQYARFAPALRYEWLLLVAAAFGGATWVWMSLPPERKSGYLKATAVVLALSLLLAAYVGAAISGAKTIAAQTGVAYESARVSLDLIRWGELPFEANRGFSTYGNPDLLGGFLVFPLLICLALALSEQSRWWRALYWAGFLLTAVAWITAFVRGAWVGGVIGLFFFAISAWRSGVKLRRIDWALVVVAVVVVAIIVGISLKSESAVLNVGERISSIFKTSEGSALTRMQIWQAAASAVAHKPIQGFGLDTFRLLFPKYKPYEYVQAAGYLSVADNVHDYPLQLATGVGIPGLILVYGVFFVAAWLGGPMAFAKGGGGPRLLQAGIWAACAAYVGHLFFGLSVTGSTIFIWILMALLLSPLAETRKVSAPSWGTVVSVIVLIACGALFIGNIVYAYADRYYLKGRIGSGGMDRVRAIEQSIKLNPTNDMYRSELGLAWQDIAVNSILQARQAQQSGQDATASYEQGVSAFGQAESALKSAIAFVPTEYDNYVFLSNLYNFGADYLDPKYRAQAVATAREGTICEPYGPAVRYQLAIALAGENKLDEAIKEIAYAVAMDTNYFEAWVLLGDLKQQKGDAAGALEAYLGAMRASPGNVNCRNAFEQGYLKMLGTDRKADALAALKAAMGYSPSWAKGAVLLGEQLTLSGDAAGAAKLYRDTLALLPEPPEDADSAQKIKAALAALEASGTIGNR
ncbi:MAG: hypothetical protein FDZ70_05125 [Actinobacteria bacterium]|nr:MAG: hypothetical protein FDZ70_05125 [Actinomycetota bacterium]